KPTLSAVIVAKLVSPMSTPARNAGWTGAGVTARSYTTSTTEKPLRGTMRTCRTSAAHLPHICRTSAAHLPHILVPGWYRDLQQGRRDHALAQGGTTKRLDGRDQHGASLLLVFVARQLRPCQERRWVLSPDGQGLKEPCQFLSSRRSTH